MKLGAKIVKVEMPNGKKSIKNSEGVEPLIDPDKWITMMEPEVE
jgi:hypothetical protein